VVARSIASLSTSPKPQPELIPDRTMRNFLNTFVFVHFGLVLWQLLSMEDDRFYFENWMFSPVEPVIGHQLDPDIPLSAESIAAIKAVVEGVMQEQMRKGEFL
jgi:hypothetical protein